MSDIFEKYAELRRRYPEALEEIKKEEDALQRLLEFQDLAEHPGVKALLASCRDTIVGARKQLASDRTLVDSPEKQRELWQLIDARMWFIRLLNRNFEAEIQSIEDQLANDLGQL